MKEISGDVRDDDRVFEHLKCVFNAQLCASALQGLRSDIC